MFLKEGIYSEIWFWEDYTSDQLKQMIDMLPPFRKEKALSYKYDRDKILCSKSYLMLCDILKDKFRILEKPLFAFGPNGKPFLKGIGKHFNFSHCPKGVLCVVGEKGVGCDIEEIVPNLDMELLRFCLNRKEIDQVSSSLEPEVEFTRLWTQKEAYLKLIGEGLTNSLPDVLSDSVLSEVSFTTVIHEKQGCVSTIATLR